MNGIVRILGIAGSLRKASFNRAALRATQELVRSDTALEIFDLEGIPPFNQDDERTLSPRVVALKAKIREADAVRIATPEYNYSVPGVVKNVIDWASRPPDVRLPQHTAVNEPEVMISNAAQRFDEHATGSTRRRGSSSGSCSSSSPRGPPSWQGQLRFSGIEEAPTVVETGS